MREILLMAGLFFSLTSFAQNDTIVITSRKNVPPQAVLDLESSNILYAGQEYTFWVTTSGVYPLRLTVKNGKVRLDKSSKKTTGGLKYTFTPLEPGECSIGIGNQMDEKRSVGLKAYLFQVIDCPMPPLSLKGMPNSQIITDLKESTEIQCAFPKETCLHDSYEIKSWSATIGDKVFSGQGSILTEELIQYVNQVNHQYLHFEVLLSENKTGHLRSEGIYRIRR